MALGKTIYMRNHKKLYTRRETCYHLEDFKGNVFNLGQTQVSVEVPNNCKCVSPNGSVGRVSDS